MKYYKIPVVVALLAIASFIAPAPMSADSTTKPRSIRLSQHQTNPATPIGPNAPDVSCPAEVLPTDGGTSGNARAPSTRYASSRAVYLILASELAAAGYASGQSVTTLGWVYDIQSGPSGMAPLKIYLQNTADTSYMKGLSFSAAIVGMTQAHNATTTLPGVPGPFDITFTGGSAFTYTGGGLYVAYDWGAYGGTLSTTAQVSCNSTGLINGLAGANSNADALTASSFRPVTRLSSNTQNDAAVSALYMYGQLPLGLVPSQTIMSVVDNKGALAKTNVPVTLNITGAQAFTNMQTIASLAACTGEATVNFAAFNPTVAGTDTVQASIPADDNNANNSLSHMLGVTSVDYSTKYPGSTADGGVGFDAATGAFVAKFNLTAANSVTQVKLEFPATSATTYRVAIYPDAAGMPSTTASYVDAADRTVTVAGPVTITLPAPVAVGPGNFYVGIQQTNTTNANYSFDIETPIRPGSFFFASPNPPTAWVDFSPGNDFKINVGIVLQNPSQVTLSSAQAIKTHGGAGTFGINLPQSPPFGVECRSGGMTNDFTIQATFGSNVTVNGSPQAQVISGTGTVGSGGVSNGGAVTVAGNVVTIPLTNVTDQQTTTVRLNGVTGAADAPAVDVSIAMSRLLGDSNGNRAVNASDVTQTKGRIGAAVSSLTFRSDFNANGAINAGDASIAKSNSGHAVP